MRVIEVSVLGGPRIVVDGVVAPLTGRQLALAVRLALTRHVPLPTQRLLEVWPDGTASEGAVRVALTRLRQVLGPHSIAHGTEGYTLAPTAHVDADRFEQLLRQARSAHGTADDRLLALDEALGLWRGRAFEGMERLPWLEYEAVRLDELREQAVDLALELRTAHQDTPPIADLRSAWARTPEREHRAALLATALYRSARQVEALDVIARTRARLRDELGLVPGALLDELELRILRHDPSLRLAERPTGDARPPTATGHHRAVVALLRVGDWEHALSVAAEAVELARSTGDRATVADALLLEAQAMGLSGEHDPEPVIDEAQAIGRALGHGPLLARAALLRFGRGVPKDPRRSLVDLTEPLELLPRDAPQQVDLLCAAAVIVGFAESGPAARRLLDAATRTHEAVHTVRSEAVCLAARAIVGAIDGADPGDLRSWADRSYELARSTDDAVLLTVAFHAVLRTAYLHGDLDVVDASLDALEHHAEAAMLPFATARVPMCRATNAIARGDLAAAPGLIAAARRIGTALRTHSTEGSARSLELVIALENGTLHERRDEICAAAAIDLTSPWPALAALVGDDGDLRRLLDHLPDHRCGDTLTLALALTALVAERWRSVDLARWSDDQLSRVVHPVVVLGFGTAALGPVTSFRGTAQLVAGDLDAAIEAFGHAADIARRSDAELWLAHARLGRSEALLTGSTTSDAERAAALADVDDVARSAVASASARVRAHVERLRAGAERRP